METIDSGTHTLLGSRGNQSKFRIGNEVVKIDTYIDGKRICTEGMQEVLCSRLFRSASNYIEHVEYNFCKIQVNDKVFFGCISDNFIPAGASESTLEELYIKFNKRRKLDRVLSGKWSYQTSGRR